MTIRVTVKPKRAVVSSVNIGPKPNVFLDQIINVDASNPDDGETLVFDAAQNKYVVKEILITSNNIINVIGGTF
jgi:hypothetical protein